MSQIDVSAGVAGSNSVPGHGLRGEFEAGSGVEWLTRQEAAQWLRVSVRWLASAEGRATVPYYKFGGMVRYSKSELARWARAQRA